MTLSYKYHEYIDTYIKDIESGRIKSSKRLKKAMKLVKTKLDNEDVFIDSNKIYDAKRIIEENFDMKLLNWQLFIIALVHCYYQSTDMVVFDEFLIMMGRGNGKNGFISPLIWYLTTPNHGVKGYNVEIIANNEEQAMTSFEDVHDMLEEQWGKMKKGYNKTKTRIDSLTTNSYIKYNTSNSRTKDGKRSACLVFDEIHEYEDTKTMNVFTSGFGKRKHSRTFKITTNGYVRGGVLDQELEMADDILNNKNGVSEVLNKLPLIYELDNEKEAEKEENWEKANPSINYFPLLKQEVKKHWIESQYKPSSAIEFYTKRMNLPKQDTYTAVAPWKKIKAASEKEIPYKELEGKDCIGGLDYADINDFASCGLLFKHKGKRIWLEHTFVNHKALKIESREIKFPVHEMVEKGLITIIYEETIQPKHVVDWFANQREKYNIIKVVGDDYRLRYLRPEFEDRGFPLESVRSGPITHAKIAPIVSSMFAEETIIWGDNPTMNWYTNNTYTEMDKKGNTTYLKIEPVTRKTDGFFSLIHALSKDDELKEEHNSFKIYDVYTY